MPFYELQNAVLQMHTYLIWLRKNKGLEFIIILTVFLYYNMTVTHTHERGVNCDMRTMQV